MIMNDETVHTKVYNYKKIEADALRQARRVKE